MFLPDRFIREPALLIPGRKPRGRVVVDRSHPLYNNLVLCMPFRGDVIEYKTGVTAVAPNGYSWAMDDGALCLELDGINQYFDTPVSFDLGDATFIFSIKTNATLPQYHPIFGQGGNEQNMISFATSGPSGGNYNPCNFVYRPDSTNYNITTTNQILANKWATCAIVRSGGEVYGYIDGIRSPSVNTGVTGTVSPQFIARHNATYFEGRMRDYMFFNRVLTVQEIRNVFSLYKPAGGAW